MFVTDLEGFGEVCGLTVEQLEVMELKLIAEMHAAKLVEEPKSGETVIDPAALVMSHISSQWLQDAQSVTVDMLAGSARFFRTDVFLDAVSYEVIGDKVRLYCLDNGEGVPFTRLLSLASLSEHGSKQFVRGEVQLPSGLYDDGLHREPGYCYLALFDVRYRVFMKQQLGVYPSAGIVANALFALPNIAVTSGRIVLHEDADSFHVCALQEGCGVTCQVGSVYDVRRQRASLVAVLRGSFSAAVGGLYSRCYNRGAGYLGLPCCAACLERRSAGLPVVMPERLGEDAPVLNLAEVHSAVRMMTVMRRDVHTVVGMYQVVGGSVTPWLFPQGAPADAVTQVPFDSQGVVKVFSCRCLQAVLPMGCVYDVGGVLVDAVDEPAVVVGFSGLMIRAVGMPFASGIVVRTRGERSKVRMMHQMFGLDPSDVFFRLCRRLDVDVALFSLSDTDRTSVGVARAAHVEHTDGEDDNWAGYSTRLCKLPGTVDIGLYGTVVRAVSDHVDVGCVRVPVGSSLAIPFLVREVVLDGFTDGGPVLLVGDDEYSLDGGGPSNSDGEFDDEV